MVPALIQVGSDTNGCTLGRKSSRKSQSKRAKADTRETVVMSRKERSVGPGFLVAQT